VGWWAKEFPSTKLLANLDSFLVNLDNLHGTRVWCRPHCKDLNDWGSMMRQEDRWAAEVRLGGWGSWRFPGAAVHSLVLPGILGFRSNSRISVKFEQDQHRAGVQFQWLIRGGDPALGAADWRMKLLVPSAQRPIYRARQAGLE
jgi:hypothetical protein